MLTKVLVTVNLYSSIELANNSVSIALIETVYVGRRYCVVTYPRVGFPDAVVIAVLTE